MCIRDSVDPARLVYIPQHSDDVLTAELTECTAESSVIRFAFGGNIGSAQDVAAMRTPFLSAGMCLATISIATLQR